MKNKLLHFNLQAVLLCFTLVLSQLSFGQQATTVSYDFSDPNAVSGYGASWNDPPTPLDANIGFKSTRGQGLASLPNPYILNGQLILQPHTDEGGAIEIHVEEGFTIADMVIYASGSTGSGGYKIHQDYSTNTLVNISNGAYTITLNQMATLLEFHVQDANNYIYVDSFEVTYYQTSAITNVNPIFGITSTDAVTVSADVTDVDGLDSVELNWGTSEGSFPNTITMNNTGGDSYEAMTSIPAQTDGTTVYYEIKATDTHNLVTLSEYSYRVEDPVVKNLPYQLNGMSMSSPFDEGWIQRDLAGEGSWSFDGMGISMTSGGTGCSSEDWLITPAFDISTTHNELISFMYMNMSNVDVEVLYSTDYDGISDPNTATWSPITSTGDYVTGDTSLQGVSNSRVHIAFRVEDISECPYVTIDNFSIQGDPADYIYANGTWSPSNPAGVALPTDNVSIVDGTATFSSTIEINNLNVAEGATLVVKNTLTANGFINNDGNITFTSTATETAQLGEYEGEITGKGNVTTERYIPGGTRAFRFLSTAVTSTNSIHANWQEGALNANDNPTPTYGTHISGSVNGTNGFDATPSGNPSLFTFDNATQTWNNIANTDATMLSAGDAYRLYVRGDRSIDVSDNESTPTATTLRATGTLVTGDVIDNAMGANAGDFNFIGNPYQAMVDMDNVLSNSTNLNTNQYYIWDPTIGTDGEGAYVTIDLTDGSPTPATSSANQFLQPGQAAFVRTLTNGTASILFEESDKASSQAATTVFGTSGEKGAINVSLYTAESYANNGSISDEFQVKFSEGESNELLPNDAAKLGNLNENIAVINNDTYLSIEHRAFPQAGEVLPIFSNQYCYSNYVYEIAVENIGDEISAYLQDNYLGTEMPLNANGNTQIYFSVDNVLAASTAANRFSIVFIEALSIDDYQSNGFRLYPNPTEGSFMVKLPSNVQGEVALSIYNSSGQKVYSANQEASAGEALQLRTTLGAGVYFVNVQGNSIQTTQKLIVK